MANTKNRDSNRELFNKLRILPFYSQYICSLLNSVKNNCNFLKSNSVIYSINTKHYNNINNLHLPHESPSV